MVSPSSEKPIVERRTHSFNRTQVTCIESLQQHNEHTGALIAALGYQDGTLLVVDFRSFQVLHRLQGHIDEIQSVSWQPLAESIDSTDKFENETVTLATSSKDSTIRLWTISTGTHDKHECTQVLNAALTKQKANAADRTRIWVPLCFDPIDHDCLYSATPSGELIQWHQVEKRWIRKRQHKGQGHGRCVFSLHMHIQNPTVMLSSSIDRIVSFVQKSQQGNNYKKIMHRLEYGILRHLKQLV